MQQLIVLSLAALMQQPIPAGAAPSPGPSSFALASYRQVSHDGGNVVCSPLSLARALAMVREGASGETADELERALGIGDWSSGIGVFLGVLGSGGGEVGYELDLASSMWGQEGALFQEPFVTVLKTRYAAEIRGVDFRRPTAACAAINEWAAKRTGGRVAEAVSPAALSADTRLVLVDAVHFRAAWESEFRAKRTGPAAFTRSDGTLVQAPTMHQEGYFRHAETARASVLELPYEGSTTALVIVLPHRGQELAEVVENEDIEAWTRALASRRVDVALPSFRIAGGREWTPALRELGISRAFDAQRAELSGISNVPYYVGAVLQNAFIAVDEEGTEAAAATVIDTSPGSSVQEAPKALEFHVDRPFLFFIRHTATGVVLFMGHVQDPTA